MNALARLFDETEHPRDPHSGEFVSSGGSEDDGGEHPGEGYSKNARLIDGVIHTSNVYDAVLALYQNRKVELNQPRGVSILLDKLGKISKDMIEQGEKAPNFNLCNVTVKGTNLFCADAKDLLREEMPQLTKDQDSPFRQYLEDEGYKIERQEQYASHLRATQKQLNGSKVAGIAGLLRAGKYRGNDNPIFVSNDDYILDGHHRWAAEIGNDAADNTLGNSKKMAIWRVNISITKLLDEANAFTEGKGKLAVDQERRKQWLLARERAHALLGRAYNEADHPRDEHGRWTDGGSSSSDGTPARYDTAKVEAKTRQNVAAASAQALKGGTTPLAGSKAEHPATIASREVTATDKQALAPKGVYGQPDVASMKLDPKRYDKDIDKFRDANFYPNFKPSDLSGSTDQAVSNIVAQMKDNLKFLYQYADKSTEIWYDGARALVDDRAKLWGFNDASIAGVYAALSPTKDWDQNVHIADMLLETYKNQQGTKWSAAMDAKSKALWSAKNQKVVDLVRGKTLGELTDPAQKALWIRTYDETHNKTDYRTVLPNGALGKVVTNADGTPSKVVWQSLPSITNAVKALEANGDRDKISEAMGTAHKVRSFYNNILDPHSQNGDVTIDTHAVGAALLRQLSSGSVAVAHNFGNTPMKVDQPEGWAAVGSSVKTGLSGLYPVYAQAYREAAQELGIQPRQLQSAVWVVKRNTFGEASKKTQEAIEAAWHEYHDNPTTTLKQTRDTIAGLLGLGKHERSYRDDAGSGRSVDARELHRAGMGSAAAAVDRRAGDGAAGRAAGLELVRREERRASSEVVERGGGLGTSAHTDFMNDCVPQLMGYGKDQITAVAACLNMWRDAWEDSHPDGANDPGPSPKEADPNSPLAADAKAFNEAEHPRDDHGRWTDGGGGDVAPGWSEQDTAAAMDKALIRPLAEKVATKLDFNPALIEFTDQDAEFELAGSKYKYAGSYTHGDPTVKLYTNQLNSSTAKGVVAHEIGHRKFYLLQQAYQAESKQVMEDPGPPPDPNAESYPQRRGGTHALMKPDGELREPYDKKYPIYQEWTKIQNMRPSLEQDDGITPYSKTYWAEWEKGKMDTGKAYHETMAEMSRNFGVMGKHSAVTGAGWRRLYDLQEKVWAATDKATRDAKTTGAVKAIFILNGVRWDVR